MLDFLMNNPIVWAIGYVIGVIGFLFAFYTWFAGRRRREFTYAKTSYQLVRLGTSTIDKLQLSFDGKPIDDLTISHFVIWNSGNEEIRGDHMYAEKPLGIRNGEEATILDASIIPETDPDHKFELSRTDTGITVHFECIEKQEGVVIEVKHTGAASGLQVDGQVQGGKIQMLGASNKIDPLLRQAFGVLMLECTLPPFAMSVLSLLEIILNVLPGKESNETFTPIREFFLYGCITLISSWLTYNMLIREIFHLAIPAKLRKYIKIELS